MDASFFTQGTTLTALLYLLAAVSDSWLLLWSGHLNAPSLFQGALCFFAAILFASAAYLLSRRPQIAHMCAAVGSVTLPWMYTTTLHGNIFVNEWIIFNVPDRDLLSYHGIASPELSIVAVALIVGAIGTGILRLLPSHWTIREMPVRDRTWPAGAAAFCFLAVWFSQSVMPYRIPGAVTYSSWPMLQMLHVQKHGFQFHEVSYRIWLPGGLPVSVDVSSNDRRLFEYRFQQRIAHVGVSPSVEEHITAEIQSLET